MMMTIWNHGGNVHSSDPNKVARSRKKNKAARKARRGNRH
jgi:hypothetical protein